MSSDKVAISRKQIGGETPMVVNQIADYCLYCGLFGSLDSARMAAITDQIDSAIQLRSTTHIILDLNNVDAIDSAIAAHLVNLADIMLMIGVTTIFCGISGDLAKTMVRSGVNLGKYPTVRDLNKALYKYYELTGQKLVPIDS
jgi:rsbT co-antagonist protein RsbR